MKEYKLLNRKADGMADNASTLARLSNAELGEI